MTESWYHDRTNQDTLIESDLLSHRDCVQTLGNRVRSRGNAGTELYLGINEGFALWSKPGAKDGHSNINSLARYPAVSADVRKYLFVTRLATEPYHLR